MHLDKEIKFADPKCIQLKTGPAVYGADYCAAWQRDANKNTHGFFGSCFPGGIEILLS